MIQVAQYHPNPSKCCKACVFGRGPHAEWCPTQQFSQVFEHYVEQNREPEIDYGRQIFDDRCLCGGVGCNSCEPRGNYYY